MTLDASVTPLEVDSLIDDPATRIIVCCGSGGVGKTTTAAALGVRAAERGRRVVVLTIDPARRLAQSLGIDSLDNTPRRVKGIAPSGGAASGAAASGGDRPEGELHAMMLDMKRTFDEIVETHADPERARAILENPFYQSLSAGFAGTQEYMAMEKLGQLRARDEWDLIVVDTPPSRSALDFLDAPKRLGSFLDGKLIKLLAAPARMGGRAGMKFLNVGMSMMTGTLGKLLGSQLLRDVQTFVAAMDTMFGGFRTRADATYRLLQAPGTAFLVVAAPERDALREAAYFVERLAAEEMPLAGLVLNRVHGSGADRLSAERALTAAEILASELAQESGSEDASEPAGSAPENESKNLDDGGIVDQGGGKTDVREATDASPEAPTVDHTPAHPPAHTPEPDHRPVDSGTPATARPGTADDHSTEQLTAGLLRLHAERMQVLAREQRTRDRFTALHPEVAVAQVAALPGDVHDLAGLRAIGDQLATGTTPPVEAV
ncbi:anion-transporting ATPase [Streptomyces inusitatus]|uniref:Anion-transporting ATPase n=1 Tax=Streptomyces inusitatus TaxID=68221 RepID=A0A918UIS7_9ACTN|nr:ArsA family ATPase [Streptomyces inusitatus]GGZ13373.1 anion-transporting ATPase [Streptomyces inusitatus]